MDFGSHFHDQRAFHSFLFSFLFYSQAGMLGGRFRYLMWCIMIQLITKWDLAIYVASITVNNFVVSQGNVGTDCNAKVPRNYPI